MIRCVSVLWIANKNKNKKKSTSPVVNPLVSRRLNGRAKVARKSAAPSQVPVQRREQKWEPPALRVPQGLSSCAMKYITALYNPFAEGAQGACIPDQYALPSQKFCTSTKGWAAVGSNGVAQILVYPWAMASSADVVNINDYDPNRLGHVYPVTYTTPTFSGVNPDLSTLVAPGVAEGGLPTGVSSAGSNSPYSAAALYGTDRKLRVVGSGIRCQYEGPVQTMGGTWLMYRSSTNTNQFPSTDASAMLRLNTTTRASVTKTPISQNYVPITPQDLEYVSGQDSLLAGGPTNAWTPTAGFLGPKACYTVAIVGGSPGAAVSFEVFTHFEMIGTGIPLTRNAPDPVAVAHVVTAAPSVPHHPDPGQQLLQAFRGVMRSIGESHDLHKMVAGGVLSALGMPEIAPAAALGFEWLEKAI